MNVWIVVVTTNFTCWERPPKKSMSSAAVTQRPRYHRVSHVARPTASSSSVFATAVADPGHLIACPCLAVFVHTMPGTCEVEHHIITCVGSSSLAWVHHHMDSGLWSQRSASPVASPAIPVPAPNLRTALFPPQS